MVPRGPKRENQFYNTVPLVPTKPILDGGRLCGAAEQYHTKTTTVIAKEANILGRISETKNRVNSEENYNKS